MERNENFMGARNIIFLWLKVPANFYAEALTNQMTILE